MITWYLHFGILFLPCLHAKIKVLPVAAILDFRHPLTSDIVHSGTIWTPDPEKVVFAYGILLVSGLQHEIHVLLLLAATIFDFPIFGYISRILKRKNLFESVFTFVPQVFMCVQPDFDTWLHTEPGLKPRKYKIILKVTYVAMSTFISQGRDNLFSCVFHHSMYLSSG